MLTKCVGSSSALEMVVVIRDKNGVISQNFSAEGQTRNGVIEVYFDADGDGTIDLNAADRAAGKCGVNNKDFDLDYFKVLLITAFFLMGF